MRSDDVKPDWRWIALDETRHWNPTLIEKCGGRIFGIYVFDANLRVFCCELTPSYELYFLRSEPLRVPEDEDKREAVYEAILEADNGTEPVSYVHCWRIEVDRLARIGYEPEDDDRESREQADDVIEIAHQCYHDGSEPDLLAIALAS